MSGGQIRELRRQARSRYPERQVSTGTVIGAADQPNRRLKVQQKQIPGAGSHCASMMVHFDKAAYHDLEGEVIDCAA
jgi:hypothetical protein